MENEKRRNKNNHINKNNSIEQVNQIYIILILESS